MKNMLQGYKQQPNYTVNSSLPPAKVYSGSKAQHECRRLYRQMQFVASFFFFFMHKR